MAKMDLGLVGLAVMGENLALNFERNGFGVSVYNRTTEKVDRFMAGRGAGKNFFGAHSLEEMTASLKSPRIVFLMVKAGSAVDSMIETLLPLMDAGDIIIDGGNSNYHDTARRTEYLKEKGVYFIGTGVSGGEEGALNGPSLMPGGMPEAWQHVKPMFEAISAKAKDGTPCCSWIGCGGAGHFVKMVHNGIEYGDMQLICEAYQLMHDGLGMTCSEMQEAFAEWNKAELDSYLIQITSDILRVRETDGIPLVDRILDTAGQKGTGKWTSIAALDEGVPLPLITESVYVRYLSAGKEERVEASGKLAGPKLRFNVDKKAFVNDIRNALYASKIVSYAQGFALMRKASETYGWELNYQDIARIWRGGCIIRSRFLNDIASAFENNPCLKNLMMDDMFCSILKNAQASWRTVCATALTNGVAIPTMAAALTYYDGYRSEHLPANLLQAQRDYFGAHTYERVDKPRGEFYHTDWLTEISKQQTQA